MTEPSREERWPLCREPSCTGIAVRSGSCFAHLSGPARRGYLGGLGAGRVLDVRGTILTDALFREVRDALRDESGRVLVRDALFTAATFESSADFKDAVFDGVAGFYKARFNEEAMFDRVHFKGDAVFTGSRFLSDRSWTTFSGACFDGVADFDGCRFTGETQFSAVRMEAGATYYGTSFERKASWADAQVRGETRFIEAAFRGVVDFEDAAFDRMPDFARATFRSHVLLGSRPGAGGALQLPSVTAEEGAQFTMRRGDLLLEESTFDGPTIISGPSDGTARVLSVRRADVRDVILANVDIRPCLFAEAHNLDELRFEGVTPFTQMPKGFRKSRKWPFVWRWTDRRAIAEELQWWGQEPAWKWKGWDAGGALDGPLAERALDPLDIARIYRALRKGREENKDEAGASDLYYGEMEMRRKAKPGLTERVTLFLFWLFSGYALRAGRALVSLALLCVAFAFLFHAFGLQHDEPFSRALLLSFETATNLVGGSITKVPLSGAGDILQVVLRVLGPLLLGLGLLSLRGRIRR